MADMHAGSRFEAFLFDMDGTILTSLAVTERIWSAWAASHGLEPATLLPTIHGIRAEDTVARLRLPGVDPRLEAEAIIAAEARDLDGVAPIAGARAFLNSIPRNRWAIVTSAPRDLALRRIAASGLPVPNVLVAAEDVVRGKPSPEGFMLGATRLGVEAGRCLAFEDSPAGVAAAEGAGMAVVVITGCQPHPLTTAHPSLETYEAVRVAIGPGPDATLRVEAR